MMNTNLLIAPMLASFIAGVLSLIFIRSNPIFNKIISVFGATIHLIYGIILLLKVDKAGIVSLQLGGWKAPFGITFVADYFSALLLVVTGVLYLAGVLFAIQEDVEAKFRPFLLVLIHFLIMGVSGAFTTGDYFNLYVCYEIMIIASFGLTAIGQSSLTLEGTFKYALLNFLASTIFLMGLGLLYGVVGSLNIADVTLKITSSENSAWALSGAFLICVGFSVKSALFPFYNWLPSSYYLPTFSVSALFAGLLTKVGLYSLFRLLLMSFQSHLDVVTDAFILISCMTMLLGVFGAATRFHMRKILSFHIISQVGYILLGIAFFTTNAVAAAIFYMIHHMIVKSNLFLISGAVQKATGHEDLSRTGGLLKAYPWLAVAFVISGFSLGGIPPLSGFFAKLGILKEGFFIHSYAAVSVGLFVSILTLYSMIKIWAEVFWKDSYSDKQNSIKIPILMKCSIGFLCALTLIISFNPNALMQLSRKASLQLLDPSLYIKTVLNTTEIKK